MTLQAAIQTGQTLAHQQYAQAEQALFDSLGLRFTERYVDLTYPPMTIRTMAIGDGRPVLVVPGGIGNGGMLAPLFAHLRDYRLITLDRPGAGLSDGIDYKQVDLRRLAVHTLEAVLDAYDLDAVPVIANSMGGLWALWLGLDRPERVLAHAQMSCPALLLGTSAPAFMRLSGVPLIGGMVHNMAKPKDLAATRTGLKYMGQSPHSIAAANAEEIALQYAVYQLPTYDQAWKSLMDIVVPFGRPNPAYALNEDELRHVSQPVQFAWGDQDPFGGLDIARRAVAALPDARLHVIPGGGHLPWFDDPQGVGERFAAFLAPYA